MTDPEAIERIEKSLENMRRRAANHEARTARLEKLTAEITQMVDSSEHDHLDLEASIAELKRLVEKHRRRLADVGQAIRIQTEVARSQDESIDELRAGQDNFDRKLAALTDAHIRAEEAWAEAGRKIEALTESQARSDGKLDALIDVARDILEGRRPGGGPVI